MRPSACFGGLLLFCLLPGLAITSEKTIEIPLAVHVEKSHSNSLKKYLNQAVPRAVELLGPAGVRFEIRSIRSDEEEVKPVQSSSERDALAHELGHYFGLGHHAQFDNLMKQLPRDPNPSLTAVQLHAIRKQVRSFIKKP